MPRLPRPALQMAVAIVGAGIMPANFYLHSALVHSRSALPLFLEDLASYHPCSLYKTLRS